MSLMNKLINCRNEFSKTTTTRQYRLIHMISHELILIGLVLMYVNLLWELWAMVNLALMACVLASINLLILKKTNNTLLCGHLLAILATITITLGNYWMGGLSSSYFSWYYVIPILAAATMGWSSLICYAFICLSITAVFSLIHVYPIYELSEGNAQLMALINYAFSFLVIVTTLYGVLRENEEYEQMLYENNFLLQADKDKFHYLARYDSLTNLPNRSYFQTYIQTIIDSSHNEQLSITVFFMDLDNFKEVNDQYGHDAGDILLSQTSKRLLSCFRENDFLARLGGDEFTAVITHLKEDKIPKAIAARIIKEFQKPFAINQHELYSRISIGLASYPLEASTVDELIAKADRAMYKAKKAGGNTYRASKKIKNSYENLLN